MYDKRTRRRRAVLILLVGLCVALMTASFGSAAGGALVAIQRGALEVLAPIQAGASRALKPGRDLVRWCSDTFHAKDQLRRLKVERTELRQQMIDAEAARRENVELRKLVNLDRQAGLAAYHPLTARVIGRSPTVWYSTVNVDRGSSDGVRVNQPVVDGNGLVGKVTKVAPHAAQVTLVTDHTGAVAAKVAATGVTGVITWSGGNPDDLKLEFIANDAKLARGQRVVTAGAYSSRLESLFPPGIPIGQISKIRDDELDLYQRVHVRPYAELRRLEFVQILTQHHPDAKIQAELEQQAAAKRRQIELQQQRLEAQAKQQQEEQNAQKPTKE